MTIHDATTRFTGKAGLDTKTPRQHQCDAARARAHRRRRSADAGLFRLELPIYPLADVLVQGGHITEWEADDFAAVEAALQRAIREWCGLDS
jgi:hypothetical protein